MDPPMLFISEPVTEVKVPDVVFRKKSITTLPNWGLLATALALPCSVVTTLKSWVCGVQGFPVSASKYFAVGSDGDNGDGGVVGVRGTVAVGVGPVAVEMEGGMVVWVFV